VTPVGTLGVWHPWYPGADVDYDAFATPSRHTSWTTTTSRKQHASARCHSVEVESARDTTSDDAGVNI
jgi:hypothetical protein